MGEALYDRGVGKWVVSRMRKTPWLTLLLGFSIMAALVPGLSRLTADFTHKGFFDHDDPHLLRFEAFERRFGNDDAVVIAMHSDDGVFDVESMQLLQRFTERMWQVPEVIRVTSLSNYSWVHADGDTILVEPFIPDDEPLRQELLDGRKAIALRHETLPGYLVSKDTKTAVVFATIKPGIDAPPDSQLIVQSVRKVVDELQDRRHRFFVTGGPAINFAFKEAAETDLEHLMPIAVLVTILLLVALLRKLSGVLLGLAVVMLSIVGAMGFAGWAGIQITNVTSVMPQMLLAVGIADAVHILVTFYRGMRHGMERKDAAYHSLTKNFIPTILTSLTTAAGFYSFITADLKPIAGLGMIAGTGTLLAWVLTYLLLGSLMFLLPVKVAVHSEEVMARKANFSIRVTDLLFRHRRAVLVVFGLLTVASIAMSLKNTVNSDPFKYFAKHFPIRVANEFVEREVGGARGIELVVDSGKEEGVKDPKFLHAVDAFQQRIDALPGVTRTLSIVDILKHTNRSLHGDAQSEFRLPDDQEAIGQELFLYTMSLPQGMDINDRVTIKNDALRITVLWTVPTSREVAAMINQITELGRSMGLNVEATGKNMLYNSMNEYVVASFIVSITAAIVLISLLLIVFFKSLKLGLLAMIPNIIPLLFGAATLSLIGQPLDIGTVLVASVCIGIAVDDTIHFLANYNLLRRDGMSPRDSVREIMHHTAPALIVTSLVLVSSFSTFALAAFIPNLYFGVMTAIILAIALVTDLTLTPALLLTREARFQATAARNKQAAA